MNKTATVRARIEPSLKREADAVLSKAGISSTEAIRIFYRHVVLMRGIPFPIHIPNAETAKVIRDARRGRGLHKAESFDVWKKRMAKYA